MRPHDSPVGLPDGLANHDPAYRTVVGDEGRVGVAGSRAFIRGGREALQKAEAGRQRARSARAYLDTLDHLISPHCAP